MHALPSSPLSYVQTVITHYQPSTSTLFHKTIGYNRLARKIAIANLGGPVKTFKTFGWHSQFIERLSTSWYSLKAVSGTTLYLVLPVLNRWLQTLAAPTSEGT